MSASYKILLLGFLLHCSLASPANRQEHSLNQTHRLTTGPPHCTQSPAWTTHYLDKDDCSTALEIFRAINVTRYGDHSFEFLAPGAGPFHTISTMRTPIKITHESCTMVIAMLCSFAEGILPGAGHLGPDDYSPVDIASFEALALAGAGFVGRCPDNMGWIRTGGRSSMGVFFWATGSLMDRRVRGGVAAERGLES